MTNTKFYSVISTSVLTFLVLMLFGATVVSAQTPMLRANGKIAFTSDRDGNPEIYLMNNDGTNQTRLTNNSIVDDHAMWSPDGQKFALVSQRAAGGFAIFQMNIDGTNRVEITPLSQFVNVPPSGSVPFSMSWSPDGRKIAFQDPYYNDIWVVDVETHIRQNLTNDGGGHLFDHNPAWSPDGLTILYASPRFNGICPALYAINPDGMNRRLVVPCQAYSPSWSPDGLKIVFVDLNDDFASGLYIANSDGTNRRIFDGVYPDPGYRDNPRWSPDGRKIAFSMRNAQDIEIYVKNVDGTGYAQLTDTRAGRNYRPSWQPLAPTACPNPIDCPEFFVRQQYLDFLSREPDADGFAYWTDVLNQCSTDASCLHQRRIGVSAAFFIESEFQETGYFVYRLYRASYGTMPAPNQTRANVTQDEFKQDRALLVGGSDLEQAKQMLVNNWVQRSRFLTEYPLTLNNAEFVNRLFDRAGLVPFTAERQAEINAMNTQGRTRAQVLRNVLEQPAFRSREYNPAFVLMQYFGYLRRDPDQAGYDFWLNILNQQPQNARGMVCAFLTAAEYQQRFGVATRSNAACAP